MLTFHVSKLRPATPGPLAGNITPSTSPAPLDIERQSTYIVKEILDSWQKEGQLQYLTDWEGYEPDERCWVLAWDIRDPLLCQEYHTRYHSQQPANMADDQNSQNPEQPTNMMAEDYNIQ